MDKMKFLEFMKRLEIEDFREFSAEMLVPEERIRAFCAENKCGSYGHNYMCPPHAGSLEGIRKNLRNFSRGLLFQHSKALDIINDRERVRETKLDFHKKVLQIEDFLRRSGAGKVWGLIGGSCELCEPCRVDISEPCPYPERARMSLEAIGIDVLDLAAKLGLDSEFHTDRIVWTGCVLFSGRLNLWKEG
jgi:predicted metal-binding protein